MMVHWSGRKGKKNEPPADGARLPGPCPVQPHGVTVAEGSGAVELGVSAHRAVMHPLDVVLGGGVDVVDSGHQLVEREGVGCFGGVEDDVGGGGGCRSMACCRNVVATGVVAPRRPFRCFTPMVRGGAASPFSLGRCTF